MFDGFERWRVEESERKFVDELKASAPVRYQFFAGIDLGRNKDATAVAIIERATKTTASGESIQTALRGLYRIKPGKSYVDQCSAIEGLFGAACFSLWGVNLLIDASGVGEGVCDFLESRKRLKFRRVSITSGDSISSKRGRIYASRNQLISTLTKLLRREGFIISSDLPLLDELLKELEGLGEESAKSGATVYRTSSHDDLTIALSLASLALNRKDTGVRTGVRPLF